MLVSGNNENLTRAMKALELIDEMLRYLTTQTQCSLSDDSISPSLLLIAVLAGHDYFTKSHKLCFTQNQTLCIEFTIECFSMHRYKHNDLMLGSIRCPKVHSKW